MHRLLMPKTARKKEGVSFTAEFSNLDPHQAEELKRMFAWMTFLGGVGSSRTFTVSYDGDGGARMNVSVDGERLEPSEEDHDKQDKSAYEKLHFGFD